MKQITNKFGTDTLFNIDDLQGKITFICTACMSVWADALSWTNKNPERITTNLIDTNNIVILSCQVTDLAILNDLKYLDKYRLMCPDKTFYVSGCLAARFDIQLPEDVYRLEMPRDDAQAITETNMVYFEKPFWTPNFQHEDDELKDGHLFRDMYPLRIGRGCKLNCTYCTIRTTRGPYYERPINDCVNEFMNHEDVLLVADSPSVNQIKQWIDLAYSTNRHFSIRNIEPHTIVELEHDILSLSRDKLLRICHVPIQSMNELILKDMGRSPGVTFKAIEIAKQMRENGTIIATNIIIDYKGLRELSVQKIYDIYDYVSWNPYWNGNWNLSEAKSRFDFYINRNYHPKCN